jgi:3',5'-cyclic AMP phosphodiesterase CpdA
MSKTILESLDSAPLDSAPLDSDGVDRRGFLKCMAWAGTGLVWTMSSGILRAETLGEFVTNADRVSKHELIFAQISDTHIGFSKDANKDVTATLRHAMAKLDAAKARPDFLIHTGDLAHTAKAEQYDDLAHILSEYKTKDIFYVPGEHDFTDDGKEYNARFGNGKPGVQTIGDGWYSFDHKGVHFVGLVNSLNLKGKGLGTIGHDQLEWLEKDLSARSASTPIVVFAHMPLWSIYPDWGWSTDDSAAALTYLKRFGSVTILNGHIHQIVQKVEGNITFHTAMSTAFPQPHPGAAPAPGPMKVEADQLQKLLGVTHVNMTIGKHAIATVKDETLAL